MHAIYGRLTLADGRTLAWCEYGPEDGQPLLQFQGTPGSRYSRHAHEEAYDRLGVRLIVFDRPGYGAASRLPGRGISAVADDAAALLDHLGHDVVHASGGSGGGPHVLAFAARHPERVHAAAVVVGAAPLVEEDTRDLIGLNRAGFYAAREGGWEAVHEILAPAREAILADPLATFRGIMEAAPEGDQAVMNDPVWQRTFLESVTESLRQGAEGWTDEAMALIGEWDFDPSAVRTSVTWWHGEHDANAPISSVRRLLTDIPTVELRLWSDAGHLASYHRHDEIVEELLSR
jgi:pimeloyl-ACP methyl ester carboxylesterase